MNTAALLWDFVRERGKRCFMELGRGRVRLLWKSEAVHVMQVDDKNLVDRTEKEEQYHRKGLT